MCFTFIVIYINVFVCVHIVPAGFTKVPGPQVCPICSKVCKSYHALNLHVKSVHPPESSYQKCQQCDKKFKSTALLRLHKAQVSHRCMFPRGLKITALFYVLTNQVSIIEHICSSLESRFIHQGGFYFSTP